MSLASCSNRCTAPPAWGPPNSRSCWGGTRRRCRIVAPVRAAGAEPACLGMAASVFNNSVSVFEMPRSAALPPEMQGARVLVLGQPGDVHSMWRPETPVTRCYWDAFALLPALVPEGPISILGLGAGTAAHLLARYAPDRLVHGWELDPVVVMLADMHMGLGQLTAAGRLVVHTGDALTTDAAVPGGSSGIIVDLFSHGQLLQQLTQEEVWQGIKGRLSSGGRVMVNLGAWPRPGVADSTTAEAAATTLAAVQAMNTVFAGEVQVAPCFLGASSNLLALTGPAITQQQWSKAVPADLQECQGLTWQPAAGVL